MGLGLLCSTVPKVYDTYNLENALWHFTRRGKKTDKRGVRGCKTWGFSSIPLSCLLLLRRGWPVANFPLVFFCASLLFPLEKLKDIHVLATCQFVAIVDSEISDIWLIGLVSATLTASSFCVETSKASKADKVTITRYWPLGEIIGEQILS